MFSDPGFTILLVLFTQCLWKHSALGALSSKFFVRRRRKEYAGRLTKLTVYPVKSMKGVDISSAECEYTGLLGHTNGYLLKDRCFMVITESNHFVTARQRPKLVLIEPKVNGDWLQLTAPDMDTISLPIDLKSADRKVHQTKVWGLSVEGVDCGDEVANWLCTYLKTPALRLLYHAEGLAKAKLQTGKTKWHKATRDVDQIAFQDGFPFMLMSEASVEDLNRRLECHVTSESFRPNFMMSTELPPFDEDGWLEIFIGDAIFRNIKPCDRCIMTTVDPETGTYNSKKEPLVTLRSYRLIEPEFGQDPCMGINLVLIQPGTVHIGDKIYITRRPDLSHP